MVEEQILFLVLSFFRCIFGDFNFFPCSFKIEFKKEQKKWCKKKRKKKKRYLLFVFDIKKKTKKRFFSFGFCFFCHSNLKNK